MLGYIRSRTNKGDGKRSLMGRERNNCCQLPRVESFMTDKAGNKWEEDRRQQGVAGTVERLPTSRIRLKCPLGTATTSTTTATVKKTNNKSEREGGRERGSRNICSTVANVQIFSLFAFRKLNFFGDIFLWLFTFHFPFLPFTFGCKYFRALCELCI